jgi:glycosyltransferase involved in cell wall biosynthesis
MKFSIATPLFNGLPKIRQAVGSIRGQVADADQSLSVGHIVQDGGSTDGTVDWLRQYDQEVRGPRDGFAERGLRQEVEGHVTASPNVGCARSQGAGDVPMEAAPSTNLTRPEGPFQRAAEPRFNDSSSPCPVPQAPCAYSFRYASEPDGGMYDAINKAWAKADGDVLAWLNHDEQYLPGTFKAVADYFDRHPDADALFGDMVIIAPDGTPLAARREIPLRKLYLVNGFLYAISCATFFRRNLFDEGLLVFNTEYRNAGDLDLILRLLSAGKRIGRLDRYLALFGVDGNNLTVALGDNIERENDRIQAQYGRLSNPLFRKAVRGLRWTERLIKGCYLPDDIHFQYAENEIPEYREIRRRRVGFRFTYDLANRRMEQLGTGQ